MKTIKPIVRFSLRVLCDLLSTVSILLALLIALDAIKDTGADILLTIAGFLGGLLFSAISTHFKS